MDRQYRSFRTGLVRNNDVDELLEKFLVSAAAAFLGIRIYLALTNYPQLGGHGLHIAHMLWGGLLMLAALVLLLSFLGGYVRGVAAILAGVGFGTFIDELGKFITSDNDYFYRPTVTLIYAIFVVLYLVFQAIGRRRSKTSSATLARALDATVTAALSGFDRRDRQIALSLLAETNPADPVARGLREGLFQVEPQPTRASMWLTRLVGDARARYDQLIQQSWFLAGVVAVMGVLALTGVLSVVLEIVRDPNYAPDNLSLSVGDIMKLGSSLLANALIVVGLVELRRSRFAAYEWFKRAVLVSLLLVQFFSFYDAELSAAWGLMFNLVLLGALNFGIRREQALTSPAGVASPAALRAA